MLIKLSESDLQIPPMYYDKNYPMLGLALWNSRLSLCL